MSDIIGYDYYLRRGRGVYYYKSPYFLDRGIAVNCVCREFVGAVIGHEPEWVRLQLSSVREKGFNKAERDGWAVAINGEMRGVHIEIIFALNDMRVPSAGGEFWWKIEEWK